MNSHSSVQQKTAGTLRILHFVTGGFSGATQVAVDLCLAAKRTTNFEVLLVLRRKPSTDEKKIQALRAQGLQVIVVSNWLHALTIWELRKIIREFRPDAMFAHGFSDHIWGRRAAAAEGVPHIFHVEHNSRERYTPRRLRQALALEPFTQAHIGVSEGVKTSLIERGFPAEKCVAICNGIDLTRFPQSALPQRWEDREPVIYMASRFARQKDHDTLIKALSLLKQRGLTPTLYLAGAGKNSLRAKAERLVMQLGLDQQVHFLGNVSDLPQRLMQARFFVLATHWEGMPLALVEGMAAGCACVASDVIGAREVIESDVNGLRVPEANAEAMADALQKLLENPDLAQSLGHAARDYASYHYGREHMWEQYQKLLETNA
ncbi:glycosyltransferase [Comamonas sp. 26]|uniref:glycosyltransferase n=1 Tax=Comamonas sp. 26 TaxID=2035201 RepID=UPI000C5E9DB6|nr:glycosyltransferase [Comamonas sp. 26]PIF98590.1 glycosyltransferase involved in cell wall biosynthesis [Comamonas sp. 26]